jgi:hypothetical protein
MRKICSENRDHYRRRDSPPNHTCTNTPTQTHLYKHTYTKPHLHKHTYLQQTNHLEDSFGKASRPGHTAINEHFGHLNPRKISGGFLVGANRKKRTYGAKTSKYRGCNGCPNQVELLRMVLELLQMAFDASERPRPGGLPRPLSATANDQGARCLHHRRLP